MLKISSDVINKDRGKMVSTYNFPGGCIPKTRREQNKTLEPTNYFRWFVPRHLTAPLGQQQKKSCCNEFNHRMSQFWRLLDISPVDRRCSLFFYENFHLFQLPFCSWPQTGAIKKFFGAPKDQPIGIKMHIQMNLN